MVLSSNAPQRQLIFIRSARGRIHANNERNVRLALEALDLVPHLERDGSESSLIIGAARRPIPLSDSRAYRRDSQSFKQELDQIRLHIQRHFGFLPSRSFLEAAAEFIAREADFG